MHIDQNYQDFVYNYQKLSSVFFVTFCTICEHGNFNQCLDNIAQ